MQKHIIKRGLACLSIMGFTIMYCQSANFYYDYKPLTNGQDSTDFGTIIKNDTIQPQNGSNYKLREAFKLTGGIYAKSDKKAIDYIKAIINMALGLVSFISLGLLIYAFYLMLFKEHEEGRSQAKGIIKGVIIALAVMGISYFIVSFIFYLYQITSGTRPNTTALDTVKNQLTQIHQDVGQNQIKTIL